MAGGGRVNVAYDAVYWPEGLRRLMSDSTVEKAELEMLKFGRMKYH